jgi:hypothetical protein
MENKVELCDGKYTFYVDEKGILKCLRYGIAWRDFVGDNAIHALYDKIIELQGVT